MSARYSDDPSSVFVELCAVHGVPLITVVGEVECTGEDFLLSTITAQTAQRPPALVVDLRQITFFGSAGVRVLVQAHADAQREGTRLAIIANQRFVLRTLAITQVDQAVHVYRNAFEALADVAQNSD